MRARRYSLIFLALYLMFVGGSAYYVLIFPVRVLHHAVITLLVMGWFISRLRNRQGLPVTPLNSALYALVLVWFVSAALSIDPRMAFENLWFPLSHLVFFFALIDLFQKGYQRLLFEAQFLMATLVIFISGLELASWYFGLGIVPGTEIGWSEVGILIPPNIPPLSLAMNISTLLAGYVAPLIPLSITWSLTARQQSYRRVLWLLAGFLTLILLLTFSRGGLMSFGGAIGVFLLIRALQWPPLRGKLSPRLILGGGLAAGIAAILVYVALVLPFGRGASDQGRLDMWRSAVEITIDHPVFGVGPGLYGRAFRDYRSSSLARDRLASAHNLVLNTASEIGLVGAGTALLIGGLFLRQIWHSWKNADSPARKLRIEGVFAAMVGVGLHSGVDVFTTTPLVLMILLLAAYLIVGHRKRFQPVAVGPRWPILVGIGVFAAYSIAFIQFDRAQGHHLNSLRADDATLSEARLASEIDPHLNLYHLQIAYLSGRADLPTAADAYEQALDLEPTWDTGWVNLAALRERSGDFDGALEALWQAREINSLTIVPLHIARLAEVTGSETEERITALYRRGILIGSFQALPLAAFWQETPLRQQSLDQFIESQPLDIQYRILAVHDPQRAATLIPQTPQTAEEWWVLGEYTLTILQDAPNAHSAFSKAIEGAPQNGDYYASRARAALITDPEAAQLDLNRAQLFGTRYESINAIRASLETDPGKRRNLQAAALPARAVSQEFAGVLFGRPSPFDLLPEMRVPGPGRTILAPWYNLADEFLQEDDAEQAARILKAILEYAPDEQEARARLDSLE